MDKRRVSISLLVVAAVALLAVVVALGRFCSAAATIDVTVNGLPLTIHGAKTMQTAIRESGLPINPGDLISLSGKVLKKSEGYPFAATVNEQETVDPDFALHSGDVISVRDGEDRIEDYDSVEEPLPHDAIVAGMGAICAFEAGEDGITEIRTGRLSGDVVSTVKKSATDATCTYYDPNVSADKVIALTFDEGPSEDFTGQILDILRDNEARATFFCVGSEVERNASLVQREREEGHQICTNTYDRAWTAANVENAVDEARKSNKDAARNAARKDTATEHRPDFSGLVDEVERGRQAISAALDGEEASRIVRLPVGTLTDDTAPVLDGHIDANIGWNVDTGDWVEFNADQVYSSLASVESGDIVLLHDGGGDRSATVEALGRALPLLKKRGYSFVTIDELLEYPSL